MIDYLKRVSKKGLTHIHWMSFSVLALTGALAIALIIAAIVFWTPSVTEYQLNQDTSLAGKLANDDSPKGETVIRIETKCDDPKKYPHPEKGCICKEDYRSSSNFRGTFCLDKGRTFSYFPE